VSLRGIPASGQEQAPATSEGIRVVPLSMYTLWRRREPCLVLGYGRVDESALEPALAALAAVIRQWTRRRAPPRLACASEAIAMSDAWV
jgi:DNA-binding transcriptional MocR family regulator